MQQRESRLNALIMEGVNGPSKAIVDETVLDEIPPHPTNLNQMGEDYWYLICGELLKKNNLRSSWLCMVEHTCKLYDEMADLAKEFAENGMMVESKYGRKPHPLLPHSRAIKSQLADCLDRLNLSPKSAKQGTEANKPKSKLPTVRPPFTRSEVIGKPGEN